MQACAMFEISADWEWGNRSGGRIVPKRYSYLITANVVGVDYRNEGGVETPGLQLDPEQTLVQTAYFWHKCAGLAPHASDFPPAVIFTAEQ